MNILCLDTSSTRTGYVLGEPGGPAKVGSFSIEREIWKNNDGINLGKLILEWGKKAWPLFQEADWVYFEKPALLPRDHLGDKTLYKLRALYSVATHVQFLAHHAGIGCNEVRATDHQTIIYGKGHGKPKNSEDLAAAWGFDSSNNDESDACGLYLWALSNHFKPEFALKTQERARNLRVQRIDAPRKRTVKNQGVLTWKK